MGLKTPSLISEIPSKIFQHCYVIWKQPINIISCIMGERGWETFQGLNAILESVRWPIAKKCQAVDGCLDINRRGR